MEGIKIGIGRVSTKKQNPQRQIEAFKNEGLDERYNLSYSPPLFVL